MAPSSCQTRGNATTALNKKCYRSIAPRSPGLLARYLVEYLWENPIVQLLRMDFPLTDELVYFLFATEHTSEEDASAVLVKLITALSRIQHGIWLFNKNMEVGI